jgi:hypothetical protein
MEDDQVTEPFTQEWIDNANAYVRKRRDDFEYWDVGTLKQKMAVAERDLKEHDSALCVSAWYSHRVKIDGKWFDLCRTDLCDDIRTWGSVPLFPVPSDVAQVTANYDKTFGARVTDDTIFIIDSISDG